MSRLDELIQEYCPDGVEYRQLKDCCNVLDKKRESEDKFVDGTYHSDENLLNNISTLNKHGA